MPKHGRQTGKAGRDAWEEPEWAVGQKLRREDTEQVAYSMKMSEAKEREGKSRPYVCSTCHALGGRSKMLLLNPLWHDWQGSTI